MATILTFLKQTPPTQLLELFTWSGWPKDQVSAIGEMSDVAARFRALQQLLQDGTSLCTDKLGAASDQIEQLRDEQGQRALFSVARANGIDLDEFEDPRACAIHLLVRNQEAFDRALASHYADRLSHGRMWSCFALRGDATVAFNPSDDAKRSFATALIGDLGKDQQSGRCQVDWFVRLIEDADGAAPARVVQATLYQEARPQVEPEFGEDGEIASRMRRPVHEGAVMFDEVKGQIDIVARGGKATRQKIAEAFVRLFLSGADNPRPIEMRLLDLSSLSSPCTFAIRAEDDVIAVEVERLRLASPDGDGFMVTVEAKNGAGDEDAIQERARRNFGPRGPLGKPGWTVVAASLRVRFAPEAESTRSKSIRVELTLPNRTNLRDQTERHRLIADVLLEHWGLYLAHP